MSRYYRIIQMGFGTLNEFSDYLKIDSDELLKMMGYDGWFDYIQSDVSKAVIIRKLNDICKELDLDIRIGGGYNGIPAQRSIFR